MPSTAVKGQYQLPQKAYNGYFEWQGPASRCLFAVEFLSCHRALHHLDGSTSWVPLRLHQSEAPVEDGRTGLEKPEV